MLYLVTGKPRNGKTLYTLQWVKDWAEKEGRPVYYHNIENLKLPWQQWEPERWQELPPRAIFVMDECQFKFPIRGRGQPPEWIEKLATHGHLGLDFVLITQDPMLIDNFVRKLCQVHKHVVRNFGMQRATVHEFTDGVREQVSKSRTGSIRHEWSYPKSLYGLYHSADAHTVKRSIPGRVWLLLLLPFVIGALIWLIVVRWQSKIHGQSASPDAASSQQVAAAGGGPSRQSLSPAAYMANFSPRVPGLAYTAPVYDEVTKPMQAPYPAACIRSRTRCQCYTQQGTRLETPDLLCQGIVDGGFFVAWDRPLGRAIAFDRSASAVALPQAPHSAWVAINGAGGGASPSQDQAPSQEARQGQARAAGATR